MDEVKFSILSYYPSFLTKECINLGILFYYNDTYKLETTSNFQRVASFDDELDINFLKIYLKRN